MSRSDNERRMLLSKATDEPDALRMFAQACAFFTMRALVCSRVANLAGLAAIACCCILVSTAARTATKCVSEGLNWPES